MISFHSKIEHGYCHCGCGKPTELYKKTNRNKGIVRGQHLKFCKGHMTRNLKQYVVEDNGCWTWFGRKDKAGYALMLISYKQIRLHRLFYEMEKGEIPSGLVIDHLCKNKSCVNPDHLETVTNVENIRRGSRTKLTVDSVSRIKSEVAKGASLKAMADKYGVRIATIHCLINGKSWKDIDPL